MVSVIIPAYNRAKTIVRSVKSVLNQTVKDIEVIVVDDKSTDNTAEVMQKCRDKRVKYVCLPENSGACAARNKGIELAKGEYIAFQDSDDVWMKNKLELQLKAMQENDADICSCSLRRHYYGKNAKTIIWPEIKNMSDGFLSHIEICRRSYISTQTIVAKREVFNEHMFDVKVQKGQDYDWSIRASRNFKVYFLACPLVEQFLQKNSITMGGAGKIVESRQYFMKKYSRECAEDKEFRLYLLKQIAHNKPLCGQNPYKEYAEIFKAEKTAHNLLCVILSKLHLIKFVVR